MTAAALDVQTRTHRNLMELAEAVDDAIDELQQLHAGLTDAKLGSLGPVDSGALRSLGGTLAVVEGCARRFPFASSGNTDTPEDCIVDGLPMLTELPVDLVGCLSGRARGIVEVLEHVVLSCEDGTTAPGAIAGAASAALWAASGDLHMLASVVGRVQPQEGAS